MTIVNYLIFNELHNACTVSVMTCAFQKRWHYLWADEETGILIRLVKSLLHPGSSKWVRISMFARFLSWLSLFNSRPKTPLLLHDWCKGFVLFKQGTVTSTLAACETHWHSDPFTFLSFCINIVIAVIKYWMSNNK